MSTSASQDRNFIEAIIGSDLLENAIDWIGKNMEPTDVFSESELESWAENNEQGLAKCRYSVIRQPGLRTKR